MTEYDWPWEIRSAVDALDSDHEWEILGAAVDGPQTFDDLQTLLPDEDAEAIDDAVSNLARGGLIAKVNDGDLTDRYAYRIELSEYGGRFVEALFDTLGSLDDPPATEETDA